MKCSINASASAVFAPVQSEAWAAAPQANITSADAMTPAMDFVCNI
jgi:hypothetical protein